MLPAKAFTRMGLIPASPQAIMLPMYKTTVPVTFEQMIRFDPVVFLKPFSGHPVHSGNALTSS
jgi:hypothetical protein